MPALQRLAYFVTSQVQPHGMPNLQCLIDVDVSLFPYGRVNPLLILSYYLLLHVTICYNK